MVRFLPMLVTRLLGAGFLSVPDIKYGECPQTTMGVLVRASEYAVRGMESFHSIQLGKVSVTLRTRHDFRGDLAA